MDNGHNFKKSPVHTHIYTSSILLKMLYSALTCQKFYALFYKWNDTRSEGLALFGYWKKPHLPAGSSSKVNSSGFKSYSLPSARAKPEELLRQIKHGPYLIIDAPCLVFCSLTLPGILRMRFRIPFPIFHLHILDGLIQNNVLNINSPTFFQNTGFIGI